MPATEQPTDSSASAHVRVQLPSCAPVSRPHATRSTRLCVTPARRKPRLQHRPGGVAAGSHQQVPVPASSQVGPRHREHSAAAAACAAGMRLRRLGRCLATAAAALLGETCTRCDGDTCKAVSVVYCSRNMVVTHLRHHPHVPEQKRLPVETLAARLQLQNHPSLVAETGLRPSPRRRHRIPAADAAAPSVARRGGAFREGGPPLTWILPQVPPLSAGALPWARPTCGCAARRRRAAHPHVTHHVASAPARREHRAAGAGDGGCVAECARGGAVLQGPYRPLRAGDGRGRVPREHASAGGACRRRGWMCDRRHVVWRGVGSCRGARLSLRWPHPTWETAR